MPVREIGDRPVSRPVADLHIRPAYRHLDAAELSVPHVVRRVVPQDVRRMAVLVGTPECHPDIAPIVESHSTGQFGQEARFGRRSQNGCSLVHGIDGHVVPPDCKRE